MSTLLVLTVGHTDVQLVKDGKKWEFVKEKMRSIHFEIERRFSEVELVSSPTDKGGFVKELPAGKLLLCTPKLDAILETDGLGKDRPTAVLILETTRMRPKEPYFSGAVLERRLHNQGVADVTRKSFLSGDEWLEDASNEIDAVIRREVVARLSDAIAQATAKLTQDDRVFVATTGGMPPANEAIKELVRLHTVGGPRVTVLEVPEPKKGEPERAVEEKFHPAAGIQARWHTLSLVEKGNLLAAWGTVNHLKGEPGQEWTRVVEWLARFASAQPMPEDCDIPVLTHPRMAVRAALRVELALRAGDIPRAVHGTVAFFESALWDHVLDHFERTGEKNNKKREVLLLKPGTREPTGEKLLRNEQSDEKEKRNCPFERLENGKYLFFEDGAGRFAKYFVKSTALEELVRKINAIRDLRNDVAHNEPTTKLMENARGRMVKAKLWSADNRFLVQPLVQSVLRELGETHPEALCADLISTIRNRLRGERSRN